MTSFIREAKGTRIPSNEIVEISACGKSECTIRTRRGKSFFVYESAKSIQRRIEKDTAQIIPAHPGYSVIYAQVPEKRRGKWKTFFSPVIGWRVRDDIPGEGLFDVEPVVAGSYDCFQYSAVVQPDGKVAWWTGLALPISVDEWLDDVKMLQDSKGYRADDDDGNDEDEDDNQENDNDDECMVDQES